MSENLKGKNASTCINPSVIKTPEIVSGKRVIATLENIRERIKASIAKHSNNTLPLYHSCASKTLSLSEFKSLLQQMQSEGEITINANGRILSPTPPVPQENTDTSPPISAEIHDSKTNTLHHCHVSRLHSVTDTRPREYLLSTIFKEIKQGNATLANTAEDSPYRTLAEVTERARELRYQRGNKEAYDILKKDMPQFIPAAVLTTRSDVKAFSHLVCLEWDGDIDTANALVIGTQHPNVLAIWRSLSGNPKFLIPIKPMSKDGDELTTENFKHAWYSASCLFEEIGDADTTAMRPTQPQALCYDPDIFVNWDALPVEWDIDEYAFEEAYPNLIATENLAYAKLPVEYHIAIQEMQWKPNGWGETSVPCPWESHENDGWESPSNATGIHKNGKNDFTFHCLKCSTSKRYSDPLEKQPKRMTVPEMIANAPPVVDVHKERRKAHEAKIEKIRDDTLSPLALKRKPIKLAKVSTGTALLDTLAKTQELIAKILRIPERIIGFRADTGTGKNHQTEDYALEGNEVLILTPTTDLAVDLEKRMIHRFEELELFDTVFRWRGLMHGWDDREDPNLLFPHRIPCVQAPRADAYRRHGGNMYQMICPTCPVLDMCSVKGFLSQREAIQKARAAIISHPDFHINPAATQFAKEITQNEFGEPRTLIQDDVSADRLFSENSITRESLEAMRDTWKGQILSDFAKALLKACCVDGKPFAIGEYLNTLTPDQKSALHFQMTRVRADAPYNLQSTTHISVPIEDTNGHLNYVNTSIAVALQEGLIDDESVVELDDHFPKSRIYVSESECKFVGTLDNAVFHGIFSHADVDAIETLPHVYSKDWTLLHQLERFFDHYPREVDAPIRWHEDTLTFVTPPKLSKWIDKAIFMCATLNLGLFKRAFPNSHIEDLNLTQWHESAKLYQLRTNRNPRATVFRFENRKNTTGKVKKVPVGLSKTGECYWRLMIDEISRSSHLKHAIITYKKVLEWKKDEEASDLDEFDNIIATAHYGNLVGLDTDFKEADVLWVLFAPEIPHGEKIPDNVVTWQAKVFFGNDPEPLNYEFNPDTGQYKDERLQQVWSNQVIAELIQAIGRGRPVRKPITTVVLTSLFIQGITDRAETKLFDEADLEIAGGLEGLADAIAKREETEEKIESLTAENTIADFQEVYGCSYEKARQFWHDKGGKETAIVNDAELTDRIRELLNQGYSQRNAAKLLNIKLGKLQSRL